MVENRHSLISARLIALCSLVFIFYVIQSQLPENVQGVSPDTFWFVVTEVFFKLAIYLILAFIFTAISELVFINNKKIESFSNTLYNFNFLLISWYVLFTILLIGSFWIFELVSTSWNIPYYVYSLILIFEIIIAFSFFYLMLIKLFELPSKIIETNKSATHRKVNIKDKKIVFLFSVFVFTYITCIIIKNYTHISGLETLINTLGWLIPILLIIIISPELYSKIKNIPR